MSAIPTTPWRGQIGVEPLRHAEVAGQDGQIADDEPGRLDPLGLLVLRVDADVADVRIGQGDELAQVGGVRQDLLIAGHGGVEDHLADAGTVGADRGSPEDRAVFQDQNRGLSQGFLRIRARRRDDDRRGARRVTGVARRGSGAWQAEPDGILKKPPPGCPCGRDGPSGRHRACRAQATMPWVSMAPAVRATSAPPRNRARVGMLRMPSRAARAWVSSVLTLTSRNPGSSCAGRRLEGRRHHPAGTAPGRPEIHQQRQVAAAEMPGETRPHPGRAAYPVKSGPMALTALGVRTQTRDRHPVDRIAMGADHVKALRHRSYLLMTFLV